MSQTHAHPVILFTGTTSIYSHTHTHLYAGCSLLCKSSSQDLFSSLPPNFHTLAEPIFYFGSITASFNATWTSSSTRGAKISILIA